MPAPDFLIGLDIGTTNVKAAALAADGSVLAQAERRNETFAPHPGWQEQSPEAVFDHVSAVLREVFAATRAEGTLRGVAISSAMHSFLAIDAAGKPLTNAWLWSDLRATDVFFAAKNDPTLAQFLPETGTPAHPMSPFFKLKWLRAHDPALFQRAHKFLGIKEFVWQRIFGKAISDLSVASATGLLETRAQRWSAVALAHLGIAEAHLPALVSPLHTDFLEKSAALRVGLPEGTPFVVGASDGALANLGSEALGADALAVTIGTSAALRLTVPTARPDPAGRFFCYWLDGESCIVGGASNNGGNVLEWLAEHEKCTLAEVFSVARQAPPGAEGLLFLPYVFGERAPLWNPLARAQFLENQPFHARPHRLRAALEGVMFNLRLIFESLPARAEVRRIHASGGFAREPFWVQMLADVFGLPVLLPAPGEGVDASVRGAVMLGRKALKMSALPPLSFGAECLPEHKNRATLEAAFARFSAAVGGR